jgi:hypothetical protein
VSGIRLTNWRSSDDAAVAEFVARHPEGLIYFAPPFRRLLLDMLRAKCRSVLAWQGAELTGVLPLLGCDGRFGEVLNTLPFFGSNGGVLAADAESASALCDAYDDLASLQGIAAATWISHPFCEPVAVPRHQHQDERIAQWTALPQSDDDGALLAIIDGSARRNVRKAERSGVIVRETQDALGVLEAMHRRNMQALGGREKPKAFFETLPSAMQFGRDWTMYVAEVDAGPVAALLLFYGGGTVEYVMPAIEVEAREIEPTAALLLRAMTDAIARGFRRWNWGGTWLTQENVYRFKRKWGAQERRYRYFITLNDDDLLARSPGELTDAYPGFFTVPYGLLQSRAAVGAD